MKKTACIFILLLTLGALVSFRRAVDQPQWSDKTRYTNFIRAKVACKLAERHKLGIESYGANMKDHVDLIYVWFSVDRLLPQDEAREIILDSVSEFVTEINQYEEIKPYLGDKPFTHENVALIFSIAEDGSRDPDPPDYLYVGYHHGELFYKSRELKNNEYIDYVTREKYEDALKLSKSK